MGAPRPTKLKLLAGTRPGRINHDEPQPIEGIPTCPTDNPKVVEVWEYTLQQVSAMGTVTMADRDTLHAYCEAVVQHREALAILEREGLVVEHGVIGNKTKHPAATIARECASAIKTLGGLFGLSPAARTAIKVNDSKAPKKAEGASRLLSG